ncbi:HlyD family secretion protein [Chloroflexota bacterium]
MKRRGIMVMFILGSLLISTIACSGGEETVSQPTVKSDITVTGDGNIEASSHERLTFGSGGKVDKISVKEGDKVNKGDVLARLDTGALELAEAQAQIALTQTRVARTQAEIAVVQAQAGVTEAQVGVTQAETELKSAELELKNAQDLYIEADVIKARQMVVTAKENLDYAKDKLEKEAARTYDILFWMRQVEASEDGLRAAEVHLANQLSTPDPEEVAIKRLQVEASVQSLELAEQNLAIAEQSLSLAKESVEHAQQTVNLAQKSLDHVRKDLQEATIIAPFDGTVASVGVKVGEFLLPAAFTGTTIVEIIDLRHMELTARVNELDIARVKTGQKVMISVDAIPETKLEGRVTFISPVAREPGAVLFEDEDEEKEYEVKIDFHTPENSPMRSGMSATAEIIVE